VYKSKKALCRQCNTKQLKGVNVMRGRKTAHFSSLKSMQQSAAASLYASGSPCPFGVLSNPMYNNTLHQTITARPLRSGW